MEERKMTQKPKKKNVIALLNEKDKLQFDYWKLKAKREEIYRKKMVIHGELLSVSRKVKNNEKRILEIIQIMQG